MDYKPAVFVFHLSSSTRKKRGEEKNKKKPVTMSHDTDGLTTLKPQEEEESLKYFPSFPLSSPAAAAVGWWVKCINTQQAPGYGFFVVSRSTGHACLSLDYVIGIVR